MYDLKSVAMTNKNGVQQAFESAARIQELQFVTELDAENIKGLRKEMGLLKTELQDNSFGF